MKTTPLKGMKDILPREQRIRDYVQGEILKTYRAAGFERISTPIMEDMENLDKSDGGDNLNLIFKVLKRGDKLEKALASGSEKELSDMGLRYDLTLPLSRYYAANREQLPAPFKVIQTDRCTVPSARRRAACVNSCSATSTSWAMKAPMPRWS